jgi:hypothetical protein
VNLSLGARYQDMPGEKNVLEYCSDQVVGLLLGFSPYPDEIIKRPIFFKSYELFKPSDRWEAQLQFGCTKQIRSIPFEDEYEVVRVELFASLDLITGDLVQTIPLA